MRLINARRFMAEEADIFDEFYDDEIPPYAILSHRWGREEVSFQDIKQVTQPIKQREGYAKVMNLCRQALSEYLEFVWIDTCCIDKSSSTELQEAINSMFGWYRGAEVCYVCLSDLGPDCPLLKDGLEDDEYLNRWLDEFKASAWFTRGWTLQELIAPISLYFHSSSWKRVGSLSDLVFTVSRITNIPRGVLLHVTRPTDVCVATRMSWAAYRQTTRIEDRAYSLLGIFNVNMPMLYGEKDKAFIRLQEEIIRTSRDSSILVWDDTEYDSDRLFATSPDAFCDCLDLDWNNEVATSFEMTNAGLRLRTYIIVDSSFNDEQLAVLNVKYLPEVQKYGAVCLRLETHPMFDFTEGERTLWLSGCPRVRRVQLDMKVARKKEMIIITRDHSLTQNPPIIRKCSSLWLLTDPAIEVIAAWPKEQWDLKYKRMVLGNRPEWPTSAVILRHRSGQQNALIFRVGISKVQLMDSWFGVGFLNDEFGVGFLNDEFGVGFWNDGKLEIPLDWTLLCNLLENECQFGEDRFAIKFPDRRGRTARFIVYRKDTISK